MRYTTVHNPATGLNDVVRVDGAGSLHVLQPPEPTAPPQNKSAPTGAQIRKWRLEANLTQEKLAKAAYLSRQYIHALETRPSSPPEALRQVAHALGKHEEDWK